MRWFKHLAHAHDDEGLSRIVDSLGVDGCRVYGIYWYILEAVAAPMEKDCTLPKLTRSDVGWAAICHCSVRVFRTIAKRFASENLIDLTTEGNQTQIAIPKLLKYRDEYSKKSGVVSEEKSPRVDESRSEKRSDKKSEVVVSTEPEVIPQTTASTAKSSRPILMQNREVENKLDDWSELVPGEMAEQLMAELHPTWPEPCSLPWAKAAAQKAIFNHETPDEFIDLVRISAQAYSAYLQQNPTAIRLHLHVWIRDGDYRRTSFEGVKPQRKKDKYSYLTSSESEAA